MINVILVTGFYIFIGNSGVLSFGHMAFVGMSAYMTAWLTLRPMMKAMMLKGLPEVLQQAQVEPFLAVLLSALFAALAALLAGAVIMRLSGIASAIATFAVLAIFNTVYSNAGPITGGVGSLVGIPTGLKIWHVTGFAILAVFIAWAHINSASGLALRAVRDEEIAAEAVGISGYRVRLLAFVLSAFVCGIAGSLQARHLGVIRPDAFYLAATFLALSMLIIGGVYSLSGAVVGAILLSVLIEVLVWLEGVGRVGGFNLAIPGIADFLVAALTCVFLVKRPLGLFGHFELGWPKALPGRDASNMSSRHETQS
ncbi:branched-chain amino acid ABC transporter permease [Paracoccus suum]|nr:branched-chain amino acid ABC transporter permease [Paracoccus suum]